jgi:outer membrane protein, multidrug efflux system
MERKESGEITNKHPNPGNTRMNKIASIFILGLVLASGCKVSEVSLPQSSVQLPGDFATVEGQTADSAAQVSWESFFQDENLKVLISSALSNNQDNLMTLERIKAARASLMAAKAGLFPAISGTAGASRRKFGEYTMDGVGNFDSNLSSTVPEDKRIPDPYKDFFLGAGFEWEIDVWGKLRNQRRAAFSRYLASEEFSKSMRTWLVSEVATVYYELLAIDAEIQVLNENIRLQDLALQLIVELKEGGRANQLAIDQFEALVLNSKSQLEAKIREQKTAEYSLNRLVGTVEIPLARTGLDDAIDTPKVMEIGIPARLIQHRPDVREAELNLQASRFDLSSAKAAFFPSINLFGMAGFNAFEFSKLFFSPASTMYQLGSGLAAPIFNRRQIQSEFEMAKANQKTALLEYEKRILNSYLEVLDLVNRISTFENQVGLKENEVRVLQRSIENSNTLFSVGYANYLEVITAQTRALESAIELADLKASRLQSHAQLYRALGGGWN